MALTNFNTRSTEGKNWFEKEPTAHVYSLSSSKAIVSFFFTDLWAGLIQNYQDFTQFTLAEKTLSDIDAKLKQSEISSRFGKIQNPVVLDVSIWSNNFCGYFG